MTKIISLVITIRTKAVVRVVVIEATNLENRARWYIVIRMMYKAKDGAISRHFYDIT
jgi:hypothetical protein